MATATRSRSKAQEDLFQRTIDDEDFIALLDDRQAANQKVRAARERFGEINETVKERVAAYKFKDGDVVRAGGHVLTTTKISARDVAFRAKSRLQTRIRPIKPEEEAAE